jgi:hypothetical protein
MRARKGSGKKCKAKKNEWETTFALMQKLSTSKKKKQNSNVEKMCN